MKKVQESKNRKLEILRESRRCSFTPNINRNRRQQEKSPLADFLDVRLSTEMKAVTPRGTANRVKVYSPVLKKQSRYEPPVKTVEPV